jgi:hypothetical protein
MGCDIHMNIEVKTKNGWELYSKPSVDRFYKLFAKLANVRNDFGIQPISEPRGIPDDVSYLVKKSYESWKEYTHSASFITCEEMAELKEWLKNLAKENGSDFLSYDLEYSILKTYCEGNSFAGIKKYPEERPKWIYDCRLVFWFDN